MPVYGEASLGEEEGWKDGNPPIDGLIVVSYVVCWHKYAKSHPLHPNLIISNRTFNQESPV